MDYVLKCVAQLVEGNPNTVNAAMHGVWKLSEGFLDLFFEFQNVEFLFLR